MPTSRKRPCIALCMCHAQSWSPVMVSKQIRPRRPPALHCVVSCPAENSFSCGLNQLQSRCSLRCIVSCTAENSFSCAWIAPTRVKASLMRCLCPRRIIKFCFTSTETIRTLRDGEISGRPPRLSHSSRTQTFLWSSLLSFVFKCCFTSTETIIIKGL